MAYSIPSSVNSSTISVFTRLSAIAPVSGTVSNAGFSHLVDYQCSVLEEWTRTETPPSQNSMCGVKTFGFTSLVVANRVVGFLALSRKAITWHFPTPSLNYFSGICKNLADMWPAATRVLQGGRERNLGTRLYSPVLVRKRRAMVIAYSMQ